VTQVAILAGGLGTRLKTVTGDLPKPLVMVAGVPLLGRQLELIRLSGFRKVLILTGYGAAAIKEYCGDGSAWGLQIHCIAEKIPRGTAGAVLDLVGQLEDRFIVIYGDTIFDVDLNRLMETHRGRSPAATLLIHPNDHPFDSDIVILDEHGFVTEIRPSPHPAGDNLPNCVSAALYVIERGALSRLTGLPEKLDFCKHVFPGMLQQGMPIFGYRSREYIKDAGTPERLCAVSRDIESGRVARMSLRTRLPAIFLDRDGVLNEERGYILRPEDLDLLPGAAAAIGRLNRSEYLSIVVTNQPVVARGACSESGLALVHARLDTLLAREGAFVDALYHCPHHPERGFPKEISALKVRCECRKPERGLIDRAVAELSIDLSQSWMVGDSTTDMELARRCGLRFVLVRTGHAGRDGKYGGRPDFVVSNLRMAVDFILDAWPKLEGIAEILASRLDPGAMVLIGGPSRSGKSSFASAIAAALRAAGRGVVIVPLDSWNHGAGTRGEGVLGRYDIALAETPLRRFVDDSEAIRIPRYDPLTRQSDPAAEEFVRRPEDVLIVEGVPALLSAELRQRADHRLFVDCNERERRERFCLEYGWRGLDAVSIERLYAARNEDEVELVRASAKYADMVLNLD
jgi:histidinol-phosphate phosphatase family protein